MTEDEAKTKWCPFARDRDGAENRVPYGESDAEPPPEEYIRNEAMAFPCIASACMAWRWADVPNPEYDLKRHLFQGGLYPPITPSPPMTIKSDTDGHCGLAGRP